jgi:hypothetical protein
MDRKTLVLLLNNYYSNELSIEEGCTLLYDYCIEKGKDPELTKQFLNIISNDIDNLVSILPYAVEYFENKFSICKIIRFPNMYEANNTKYKVLLVF